MFDNFDELRQLLRKTFKNFIASEKFTDLLELCSANVFEEPPSLKNHPKKLGICILISTLIQRKQHINQDYKPILLDYGVEEQDFENFYEYINLIHVSLNFLSFVLHSKTQNKPCKILLVKNLFFHIHTARIRKN